MCALEFRAAENPLTEVEPRFDEAETLRLLGDRNRDPLAGRWFKTMGPWGSSPSSDADCCSVSRAHEPLPLHGRA
jgi:hypothetical protein